MGARVWLTTMLCDMLAIAEHVCTAQPGLQASPSYPLQPHAACVAIHKLDSSWSAESGCGQVQDCEFTYLSTQVLHLLGIEGPRTKEPAKYIRYIYNRVILENATVRAAAVSSLAQFGALVAELRPRIQVLLKRALHDNDDEVAPSLTFLPCTLQAARPLVFINTFKGAHH